MRSDPIEIEISEDLILPCYRHLHDEEFFDIELIWGGRDSGKSHEIAQLLIIECLQQDYFRCIMIKKTFESVKDSQWQTIKDVCESWGIDHLFTFTVSPLSITCKVNGNKFIARGCDKADKIKSVKDPSSCWIEEADQISHSDYITIATTLRGPKGTRVKQYLSFNPETSGERDKFWIYKRFFNDPFERNFEGEIEFKDLHGKTHELLYRSTHTTYKDNPYCTPQRMVMLENLKIEDPYYYDVFTLGNWGQKQKDRPFFTSIRPEHVTAVPQYNPARDVICSMDFNINPFAFIFAHKWTDKDGEHLHIFDEATIESGSIDKAVTYVKDHYPQSIHRLTFTGDPGGNKREFSQRDNASLYTMLSRGLKLRPAQLIVPSAPRHKNSKAECNYFLHHFPDFQVNKGKCPNLVFDLNNMEVDEHDSIIKSNRDKKDQRADHGDAFRYLVNTFFKVWIYNHQKIR